MYVLVRTKHVINRYNNLTFQAVEISRSGTVFQYFPSFSLQMCVKIGNLGSENQRFASHVGEELLWRTYLHEVDYFGGIVSEAEYTGR